VALSQPPRYYAFLNMQFNSEADALTRDFSCLIPFRLAS